MLQLKTTFAGLSLENPIIVGSSGLTDSAEKIKAIEKAGAGAVVLKSVFEEQIKAESGHMDGYGSPEAEDYLQTYVRSHALSHHVDLIREAKKSCRIPVIASINCYSDSEWTDFARLMEEAGADALELNVLSLQTGKEYAYGSFEQRHIEILRHIKKAVNIPVIFKLGSNFTNPVALVNQLYANGAAAVVLFNRFYQPDISIDSQSLTHISVLSNPHELAERIRWTAIASAEVPQLDYAVSGGIYDGKGIIKAILAGASAVEICSAFYQHGLEEAEALKQTLAEWMKDKGYESVASFKGKMNACTVGEVNPFERTQFMKYYSEYKG